MQDLHSRRDELSSAKRALLEQRLRGRGGARPQETIQRCAGDGPDFPMSFAQERMWFLAQFEPGNPMYNVPVALLVRTDIDIPRLERALRQVVTRHESLRTVFRMVDGELRQVVEDPYDVRVELFDVRDRVRSADPMEDIRRLVAEEGARVFDVSRLPLFRVTLLRVSDERYAMVITTHHIATDGWSMPMIITEMDELYTAYTVGRPTTLREPTLRYADYSVWQRQYLTGATLEKQVGYWRGLLEGAPTLELPTDRPRPPQQSFRGAFHRFNVSAEITLRLRELCRQEAVTLNMVVLAAFNVLLHRWSGQDDVVVGTLLGNRSRAELEDVLGYFVNTAALRMDVSGDPPFREVVRRAREAVLDADAHQELPFERLVDALGLERDLSRHPIFQVMYFHHVFVGRHHSAADGMVSSLDPMPIYAENTISLVDTGVAKFDLMLATMESPTGLMGVIEYATDLFDLATVQRFGEHLVRLLEQAAAAPDQPISRMALLEDEELERMAGWNEAARRDHPFVAIPELFERQVAAAPDAPAIWFRGATTTYGELNSRANRIARRLRAAGVGRESIVGVCLERTPELIATLLAVHKAGGAYTPLQPSYPAARIAAIVADAEPLIVVATSDTAPVLPANQRVLLLDRDAAEIGREDDSDPRVPTDPRQLAYVIYTSGSTGTPKGVQVEHLGVSALLHWLKEAVPDEERASTLAATPVVFDVSVGELFGTLCWGGRLVLVENAIDLAALPESVGVKLALVVPTAAGELARMGTVPSTVTAFNLCGEAVSGALAADLHALPGVSTVRNIYGPTEATVYATAAPVLPGDPSPSIGRPVHDTRAYVLDRGLQLLAPGLPGELFLGGAGVARGYANRPALTAERFLPDPHGAPGSRMYRTGDRARFRPDGDLAYLGRMDTQVKVRGHRVELGEIEVVLLRHPAVHDAVVAARRDAGAGHSRLVAYIVPAAGAAAPSATELRAHLRERVPDYMVPSAFVVLDSLPAGPSGKVDRAALPAPDPRAEPAATAAAWVDPAGGVEATLASVWAAVLRRDRVSAHDNFFELGGDSILAIQVVTRAAQHGIRLSPRQMFQHQTVAEQAAVAGAAAATHAEQGTVVGDAPLTPVQRWFFEQDLPDPHHWNQAHLWTLAERADPATMARAIDALLSHHDALRMRFERAAGGWRQRNELPLGDIPFERVELGDTPDAALATVIAAHAGAAQASLKLAEGPLLRAVLYDCGAARPQRYLLAIHHLVVDALSWSVLQDDLATAYRQLAAGEEVRLPPKTTAFRDWARRLDEHSTSRAMRDEAAFWRAALPPVVAPVPVDRPDAPDTEGSTDAVFAELDEAETRALLHELPAAYATQVPDALLAALARAYAAWSRGGELLVDVEGHGREEIFADADVSRTVGWFTTIHPLHLRVAPGASPGDTLRDVKERIRAVPNHGIGYGLLRHQGDGYVADALRALPRAEISFNYLGQGGAENPFLAPAAESAGPNRSPRAPRRHRIAVEGMVAGGRLRMGFHFGGEAYLHATVEELARAFTAELRALVEHCRAPDAGGFTPSDFPEAGLDQDALDALMEQLG